MNRKKQMVRIIEVAHLIHNEPRQWTRPRLADYFDVDKTTIQRDIKLLCEMGIEIVPRGKAGYEIISDFFLPPLNLDFREALALVTAASFYRGTEGERSVHVLDSAIGKITSTLPTGTRDSLYQLVPRNEIPYSKVSIIDEKQPHKDDIYLAMRERHFINIQYNSYYSGKITRHRVSPYAVIFRKNAWYLIGWTDKHSEVRTFRINRIESLRFTEREYDIPEDFSIQKYLEKSWDIMTGPEVDVEVHFASRVAPLIREINWHPTQKLKKLSDGTLQFQVTVAGWEEIGRWILGWGSDAMVIQPTELREWISETASKMVEMYKQNN